MTECKMLMLLALLINNSKCSKEAPQIIRCTKHIEIFINICCNATAYTLATLIKQFVSKQSV